MSEGQEAVDAIVETLRTRLLRALQSGAVIQGDRLPSARDLVREFDVDHRLILAAYRRLADEGLVELRRRGGIYVTARPGGGAVPPLPEAWVAGIFTQALAREIAGPELHEWLRRCTETLRLRAAAIAATSDQAYGLCRELRDDFGLESEVVLAEELVTGDPPPLPVRRADLLVTTEAHAARVRELGTELRKAVTVIELRPDLTVGEWALLLRRPVYAVVATAEFGQMLHRFFAEVPGVDNLRVLVIGRDDLREIPDGAPTYVTQSVRAQLAGVPIRGRILPAARTISMRSAQEIFAFIVHSNVEALGRHSGGI